MMSPELHRLSLLLATIAEQSGAPKVAALLAECMGVDRDEALCMTADELRRRGRDGLASQVLAYRFEESEVA